MDPLTKEIKALREKIAVLTEDRKEELTAMNFWVQKAGELEQKLASTTRHLKLQCHLAALSPEKRYYEKHCRPFVKNNQTIERTNMKQKALEALDSMDDFARMANIDPIGPRKILEDFINNSFTADQLRQAKVKVLREAVAVAMWSVYGLAEGTAVQIVRTDELCRMADEIERSKT